jgi:hypothetical protein
MTDRGRIEFKPKMDNQKDSIGKRTTLPIERMTGHEYYVWKKAVVYDDIYFRDLRFETRETRKYLRLIKLDELGREYSSYDDPIGYNQPDFSSNHSIKLSRLPSNVLGRYNKRMKRIDINIAYVNIANSHKLKALLIHEIIHFYEHHLWNGYIPLMSILLYEKLNKALSTDVKHLLRRDEFFIRSTKGGHGGFFLLKSLELDLKLRWQLGTVYGYGREDMLKDVKTR